MALSRVISEIFNVEKCRDLEIGVRDHSRSLTVVPFGRSCMVFRLDALALSVIATATWLAGWLGGWLSVTAAIVSKRLNLS